MIIDETPWRDDDAAIREAFRKIDRTAKALGFDGDGDLEAARPNTLAALVTADSVFLEAELGPLPDWLRDKAVERCRRIIGSSGRPQKCPRDPAAVVRRVLEVAKGLRLDGDLEPPRHIDDLDDDRSRVAAQIVDRFIDCGDMMRHNALAAACSIVGNSTDDAAAGALWRLRNARDPLRDCDADIEKALDEAAINTPPPAPEFASADLVALATSLRGGV